MLANQKMCVLYQDLISTYERPSLMISGICVICHGRLAEQLAWSFGQRNDHGAGDSKKVSILGVA